MWRGPLNTKTCLSESSYIKKKTIKAFFDNGEEKEILNITEAEKFMKATHDISQIKASES